jgi:hypothetical protein
MTQVATDGVGHGQGRWREQGRVIEQLTEEVG